MPRFDYSLSERDTLQFGIGSGNPLCSALSMLPGTQEKVNHHHSPFARSQAPRVKLAYFDGLRGIAAFVVCILHFLEASCLYHTPLFTELSRWPIFILWNGPLAVMLFYMLSGRVLGLSFLNKDSLAPLASAFIRRPLRLALPLQAGTLLAFVSSRLGLYNYESVEVHSCWWYGATMPAEDAYISLWRCLRLTWGIFFFLPAELPPYPGKVIWTIPFEYSGSFFVYTISAILITLPKSKRVPYFSMYVLYLTFANTLNAPFALGLLFALLRSQNALPLPTRRLKLSLWTMFILLNFSYDPWMGDNVLLPTYCTLFVRWFQNNFSLPGSDLFKLDLYLAGAAFLLLVELDEELQDFFSGPFPKFLGRVSFGLYLIHPHLLGMVVGKSYLVIDNFFPFMLSGTSYYCFLLLMFVIYIPLSLYCGYLFTIFIDEPSVRLTAKLAAALLPHQEVQLPRI